MNSLEDNPFALLTFLAAPAILTNASSIIALSTSNRFGLAIERINGIWSEININASTLGSELEVRVNHVQLAERRARLLVRAMVAFYLSVGSFAAGTLVSLMGSVLYAAHQQSLRQLTLLVGLCAGAFGVAGMVAGCIVLLLEARIALQLLAQDSEFRLQRIPAAFVTATPQTAKEYLR